MTKYMRCVAVLAALLLASAVPARASSIYMSADNYMIASKDERLAFVLGVVETLNDLHRDGLILDESLASDLRTVKSCAHDQRVSWLEETLTGWLDGHVERWDEAMSYLVVEAVLEECSGWRDQSAQNTE